MLAGKTWIVKSSGTWGNGGHHEPWFAFDHQKDPDTCYHTIENAYENGEHKLDTNIDGKHKGEWVSIQLPEPFVLAGITMCNRNKDMDGRQVYRTGWVLGSNDGEKWEELCAANILFGTRGQVQGQEFMGKKYQYATNSISVDATTPYTHFAIVFESASVHDKHHKGAMIAVSQFTLYGDAPEPAK